MASTNQPHHPWYNRLQTARSGYQNDHSPHNPRHTYSFHNPPTTQHRYEVSSQPHLLYLSHHPLQISKKCSRCAARCVWPVNHDLSPGEGVITRFRMGTVGDNGVVEKFRVSIRGALDGCRREVCLQQ